ncbi:MAG TPA: ATP-binding protein [Cyclobacteriaceae bacterium]|nr:ATP-binding protein [Cyclobacteriaceae bacterium]
MNNSLRKVAIVGPECTGKSELAMFLAKHYNTQWVPEYARNYLDNLVRPYNENDLIVIAHGQKRLEEEYVRDANGFLFIDTTLLVIKIWSEFKYGRCDPTIIQSLESSSYDLHLLTYIDIPWEADPQREHPDKRAELYQIYLAQIKAMKVPFAEIRGERQERRTTAIQAIESLKTK